MAARAVELCEDIAAYLKATPYNYSFITIRKNPNFYKLEEHNRTHVFVYPGPRGGSTGTRGEFRQTYGVMIHMMNYVDAVDLDEHQQEIDNAAELIEEIEGSLENTKAGGLSLLEFGTEDNPEELYNQDDLSTKNMINHATLAVYQEYR